jgi:hypothetical protein
MERRWKEETQETSMRRKGEANGEEKGKGSGDLIIISVELSHSLYTPNHFEPQ